MVVIFCLFALFPNEAAKIIQTYIVTSGILQSNMPKHLHAECLQILSLGLTMCQSLFSCGHLILHQNCCWPFLVFMMSVWIFITVWAPDTKQTASIACFYSCKVWTREISDFLSSLPFFLLGYFVNGCRWFCLKVLFSFPEKIYLHRSTLIAVYILSTI